jgi:hypothetical protein
MEQSRNYGPNNNLHDDVLDRVSDNDESDIVTMRTELEESPPESLLPLSCLAENNGRHSPISKRSYAVH